MPAERLVATRRWPTARGGRPPTSGCRQRTTRRQQLSPDPETERCRSVPDDAEEIEAIRQQARTRRERAQEWESEGLA